MTNSSQRDNAPRYRWASNAPCARRPDPDHHQRRHRAAAARLPRGSHAWPGAGASRVSADLVLGPPDPDALVLGWPDPGLTFDIALHVGTLAAVAVYFWADWLRLLRAAPQPRTPDGRLFWLLVLGAIPGGIAGVLLDSLAEQALRSPLLIAGTLALMGLGLLAADRWGRRDRDMHDIGPIDVPHRPGAGMRDRAGRVALGDHDRGGAGARHRARGGGAFLVPAGQPDHPGRGGL